MRVGNLHGFEDRRHAAILAPLAVESVKCNVGGKIGKHVRDPAVDVHFGDAETGAPQRCRTTLSGTDRDLAFRGPAAEEHGDMRAARLALHDAPSSGMPMRLTSQSRSMPDVSRTFRRTV